jgi:hypothetical protein
MQNNKIIVSIVVLILIVVGFVFVLNLNNKAVPTENIGNVLEKADLIRIEYPRPNQVITSPLVIKGEARGNWFFEASFPIVLTDWDGKIIAQGFAKAKKDWMTTDFVPYEATLNFTIDKNIYNDKGTLILRKDNPSDIRANDDALEIPIIFGTASASVTYKNADYGFNFSLPDNWKGYSVVQKTWTGTPLTPGTKSETGPKLLIRNPNWTADIPYEDIPILVFTLAQWDSYTAENFTVSAAPIPASELARNNSYVFALPPRWDFDYSKGVEDAQNILKSNPLKTFDINGDLK